MAMIYRNTADVERKQQRSSAVEQQLQQLYGNIASSTPVFPQTPIEQPQQQQSSSQQSSATPAGQEGSQLVGLREAFESDPASFFEVLAQAAQLNPAGIAQISQRLRGEQALQEQMARQEAQQQAADATKAARELARDERTAARQDKQREAIDENAKQQRFDTFMNQNADIVQEMRILAGIDGEPTAENEGILREAVGQIRQLEKDEKAYNTFFKQLEKDPSAIFQVLTGTGEHDQFGNEIAVPNLNTRLGRYVANTPGLLQSVQVRHANASREEARYEKQKNLEAEGQRLRNEATKGNIRKAEAERIESQIGASLLVSNTTDSFKKKFFGESVLEPRKKRIQEYATELVEQYGGDSAAYREVMRQTLMASIMEETAQTELSLQAFPEVGQNMLQDVDAMLEEFMPLIESVARGENTLSVDTNDDAFPNPLAGVGDFISRIIDNATGINQETPTPATPPALQRTTNK